MLLAIGRLAFEVTRSDILIRIPYLGEFYMEWFSSCPGSPRVRSFDPWSEVVALEGRLKAG